MAVPQRIAPMLTRKGWNPRVIRAGSRFHKFLFVGQDSLILTTQGRNLEAHPEVGVQTSRGRYRARILDDAEAAALWPRPPPVGMSLDTKGGKHGTPALFDNPHDRREQQGTDAR